MGYAHLHPYFTSLPRYRDSGIPCPHRPDSATRGCTGIFPRHTASPVCTPRPQGYQGAAVWGSDVDSLDMGAELFICMCEEFYLVWERAEGEKRRWTLCQLPNPLSSGIELLGIKNSKFEPGLPGHYDSILVKVQRRVTG